MSKTPALLFMPIFYLTIFFEEKNEWSLILNKFVKISLGLLIAGFTFYSFRIVPLFSQLFAVGGNFLQEPSVLFSIKILEICQRNGLFFFEALLKYLGPVVLFLALPLFAKTRRKQTIIFLSGVIFLLPLICLGKIIYTRYALPSALFF
jgi:hypothetical protein